MRSGPHGFQGQGSDDIDHIDMADKKALGNGTPILPLGDPRQRYPFFPSV